MYHLQNDILQIAIAPTGAELTSIKAYKKQYLWEGDAKFWGGQAPILFPFVGKLKNDTYFYKGKKYQQSQHGFFRRSEAVVLEHETENALTFLLKSSPETLTVYPFEFEFRTTYTLIENRIHIKHKVNNAGTETLYFSLGEHPAFKCSLRNKNESYEQCTLVFEKEETAATHLIEGGLIGNQTEPVLENSNVLNLYAGVFDKDALVFKQMNSKKVTLHHQEEGDLVTLSYPDFPFLGIWSKPGAPFVCIEPWLGIADSINASQQLEEKEGIITVEAGKNFEASYTIEVHAPLTSIPTRV